MSSSIIKDLGEHPEDKKLLYYERPIRTLYQIQLLNATIPEEKDPTELTMEEALILIEKEKNTIKLRRIKKK